MAMDSVCGQHADETLVLLGRDDERRESAASCISSHATAARRVSLSFMRRDPDTPNGLTEFLVRSAAELLREHGSEGAVAQLRHVREVDAQPERWYERLLGRLVTLGNPFFQIESLYRFNAKFFPRWEPRYLVYEGALGLPRAGLAAMWAEGQLPKPRMRPDASGGPLTLP